MIFWDVPFFAPVRPGWRVPPVWSRCWRVQKRTVASTLVMIHEKGLYAVNVAGGFAEHDLAAARYQLPSSSALAVF